MSKQAIAISLMEEINKLLDTTLSYYHTTLTVCTSIVQAQSAMLKDRFCLVIIDTSMMAQDDILKVVLRMRMDTYAPIVILAPADAAQPLLNAGADVCLPASTLPETIVSHALALIRRYTLYNHYDETKPDDVVLHRGQLFIDVIRHRITLDGEEIILQPREFRLLWHFARNPGIIFSAERIGEIIWPGSYDQNRDVSALIAELRRKLGDDWEHPTYIETIRYVGYRFLPKW